MHVHQNILSWVPYFTLGGRVVLSTAREVQNKKQKMVNDVYVPSENNSCFLNQLPNFSSRIKFTSKQVEFISCGVF